MAGGRPRLLSDVVERWREVVGSPAVAVGGGDLPNRFDVSERAVALGVALSPEECDEIRSDLKRGTPAESRAAYIEAVEEMDRRGDERDFLVSYITKSGERSVGQRTLEVLDFMSTALFAVIGAHFAGAAGMNQGRVKGWCESRNFEASV